MFFAVIAHSEDIDGKGVLAELLEQCRDELGERVPQAAILYCTIDLEHDQLVQGIDDAWPGIALIGCTTDGGIRGQSRISRQGLKFTLTPTRSLRADVFRITGVKIESDLDFTAGFQTAGFK